MKNNILYIIISAIISYTGIMLPGQSECPPLNYIQFFDNISSDSNHQLDALWFNSTSNAGAFPITQNALNELKKAPDGPVTCLHYKESWNMVIGGIIPADVMQKIKNFETANPCNNRSETIYAFNQYSPQDIWNKTDSQKKDSKRQATIEKLQQQWLEAQQANAKIDTSANSYSKYIKIMACLFAATGLYLFLKHYYHH